MSFIEKSVARLDQQDRLEALAVELGKGHYHYNAPPKYYSVRPLWPPSTSETVVLLSLSTDFTHWTQWTRAHMHTEMLNLKNKHTHKTSLFWMISQYVGAEFVCAVQPILKERWTSELEGAWKVRRSLLGAHLDWFDACSEQEPVE